MARGKGTAYETGFSSARAAASRQRGQVTTRGDSLIVATMQAHGLTNLASNDGDFDRVSGLTRYAPL
jgi:predicted nucleic acid-binding protein